MILLSISSTIRFILIMILVFWLFRMLMRILGPIILRKSMEKMQERMHEEMKRRQPERAEGEITIDHKPPLKDKKKDLDDGEYVDYEEIK